MMYEPHTERVGPGEEIELPSDAVGVSVELVNGCYHVHYLEPQTDLEEIAWQGHQDVTESSEIGSRGES